MAHAPAAIFKILTDSPQLASGPDRRPATRGGGEVFELDYGVTVYPASGERGRWRAVWHEDGERQQCEASSEDKLAVKLVKVTERLAADAPLSHHLKVLSDVGLLDRDKRGVWVYYRARVGAPGSLGALMGNTSASA